MIKSGTLRQGGPEVRVDTEYYYRSTVYSECASKLVPKNVRRDRSEIPECAETWDTQLLASLKNGDGRSVSGSTNHNEASKRTCIISELPM